jgi:hypothetical protein
MCLLRRRHLDPKSRRIYAAGNLCLISGLTLTLSFEGSFGHRHRVIFDGLRFLLMSLAITLFFWAARRAGGCVSRS